MTTAANPVSIVRCTNYDPAAVEAAVRQSLDNLGGITHFVKPGMRVLLKPNLLAARNPTQATTTHPAVVSAVARLVQEVGGTVTVVDSPGGPFVAGLMKSVYAATGMEQVARETGLTLNMDFTETEVVNPQAKLLKRLRLITAVASADLVINLPKLKTHGQMVYTGAVKNMFGAIPGTEKIEYHMRMASYDTFADTLIDIFLATRTTLNLMDAVIGMEGAGPSAGDPRHIGLLLASPDAFALDFAALHIVGANPLYVPVIKAAIARDLCPSDLKEVTIAGCPMDEVRVKNFNIPAIDQMLAVTWTNNRLLNWLADRTKPRPVFHHATCTGCKLCQSSCPAKVITMTRGKPQVDLKNCIRCFCCQELCPARAITIHRRSRPTATLLRITYFILSMLAAKLHRQKT